MTIKRIKNTHLYIIIDKNVYRGVCLSRKDANAFIKKIIN